MRTKKVWKAEKEYDTNTEGRSGKGRRKWQENTEDRQEDTK